MKANRVRFFIILLAILFPAGIFFFLRIFGKNVYVVAPLFEHALPSAMDSCGFQLATPYQVPDSLYSALGSTAPVPSDSALQLFVFAPRSADSVRNQMKRVDSELGPDGVRIVWVPGDTLRINRVMHCLLFLHSRDSAVLLDGQGRIRGYYAASSLEDVDRLITEARIILGR